MGAGTVFFLFSLDTWVNQIYGSVHTFKEKGLQGYGEQQRKGINRSTVNLKTWKKKNIFLLSSFWASFVTTADRWNLQALPSCQCSRRHWHNIETTLATNQTTPKDGNSVREEPGSLLSTWCTGWALSSKLGGSQVLAWVCSHKRHRSLSVDYRQNCSINADHFLKSHPQPHRN